MSWVRAQTVTGNTMDLLRPPLDAGIMEKAGGNKSGRYRLKRV